MSEKISVLMPVYNREKFIERSVDSILNQTYRNIELIIYDDGSSDGSTEMIMQLCETDNRIRLITEDKNKGVGYARNRLLEACNTRYAIWMDSDDISALDRIERQWGGQQSYFTPRLIFAGWENLAKKTKGTTQGFATLMFPVDKDILFNESMLWGGEDWDWIARMKEKYNETNIDNILYSIDFHGDRIGTWKRKIDKNWNGKYDLEDIKDLSYEETINKYKKDINEI